MRTPSVVTNTRGNMAVLIYPDSVKVKGKDIPVTGRGGP
jgi:hypothetical protein